jgi:hypothetical protein
MCEAKRAEEKIDPRVRGEPKATSEPRAWMITFARISLYAAPQAGLAPPNRIEGARCSRAPRRRFVAVTGRVSAAADGSALGSRFMTTES